MKRAPLDFENTGIGYYIEDADVEVAVPTAQNEVRLRHAGEIGEEIDIGPRARCAGSTSDATTSTAALAA